MKKIGVWIATLFNIGRMPFAPGTWGSLVTTLLVYFIDPYWQAPLIIRLAVIFVVFLVGIPAANAAEKHFNKKDPGQCVIDEVAGQMVTLLVAPHHMWAYLAGFLAFRFFDIIKPFPIRRLEKIHGGLGIMVDDIAAGIYAAIVLYFGLKFFPLI